MTEYEEADYRRDVVGGGKFYCQLEYRYNPLFKLDLSDVVKFAYEQCPSLKNKKGVVLVMDKNNKRVIV